MEPEIPAVVPPVGYPWMGFRPKTLEIVPKYGTKEYDVVEDVLKASKVFDETMIRELIDPKLIDIGVYYSNDKPADNLSISSVESVLIKFKEVPGFVLSLTRRDDSEIVRSIHEPEIFATTISNADISIAVSFVLNMSINEEFFEWAALHGVNSVNHTQVLDLIRLAQNTIANTHIGGNSSKVYQAIVYSISHVVKELCRYYLQHRNLREFAVGETHLHNLKKQVHSLKSAFVEKRPIGGILPEKETIVHPLTPPIQVIEPTVEPLHQGRAVPIEEPQLVGTNVVKQFQKYIGKVGDLFKP